MFGGPGHDILLGYESDNNDATAFNRMYGDDGDDFLFHVYGYGELFGGAGDDVMEGGVANL